MCPWRWKQIPNGTERNQRSPSRGGRPSGLFGNSSSPLKNWRMSFAPSIRRSSAGSHTRGSSLPTFSTSSPNTPGKSEETKRSTSPWKAKFQRPSVMGHFTSISESEAAKSRPSFGSSDSYPPSRPSFEAGASLNTTGTRNSIRSSSGFAKSSQSLWSLPPSATHMNDPPGSTKLVSQPSKSTIRVPFSLKPSGNNVSGSPPSIISSGRKRRRKRLVIGGIPLNDHRRFEAAKRWCEVCLFFNYNVRNTPLILVSQSFGEVSSITRGPNGDILVDFRKAEVADTVRSIKFPPLFRLLTCSFAGMPCSRPCQHRWSWQLFPLMACRQIIIFVEVSISSLTCPSFISLITN